MNPLEFAELLNEVPDDMLRSANDYSCRRRTAVLRVFAALTAAAAAFTGLWAGMRWLEKQKYINRVPNSALSALDSELEPGTRRTDETAQTTSQTTSQTAQHADADNHRGKHDPPGRTDFGADDRRYRNHIIYHACGNRLEY